MNFSELHSSNQIELFKYIADNVDNSIMIADANGDIFWVNESFRSLIGYSLSEFQEKFGKNLLENFPNAKTKNMVTMFLAENEPAMYQYQLINKNGNTIWLQRNLIPVINNDVATAYIAVDSDMTIVKLAMEEINLQKKQVEEQRNIAIARSEEIMRQKQQITDSIQYASNIQRALLPPEETIKEAFPDFFILYKPRDIVSGDFYWLRKFKNATVLAVADCTGHGVPGAFMSVLGISFLNEIVTAETVLSNTTAAEILDNLKAMVIAALRQTGKSGEMHDGMDIALCVINNEKTQIQYAGAYNPLLMIRNGEVVKYKADRMPIGIYQKDKGRFNNNIIDIQKDDLVYLFSDGYVDQVGNDAGKKYMSKPFQDFLLTIYNEPIQKQGELLDIEFNRWRGSRPQVDDIVIIGIKF